LPGDNNIFSALQWLAQGLKGFSSHNNRHGPGDVLKIFHVIGQMPGQRTSISDRIIFSGCYDQTNNQIFGFRFLISDFGS